MDGIEVMFYLFALSAVLHFVIQAGGGSPVKYWPGFVPAILLTSVLLVGVAPAVYRREGSSTESVPYDRGGCHSAKELDTKFKLRAICPSLDADFMRYDFNNFTEENVRVGVEGIELLSTLADSGLLANLVNVQMPRLESFLIPKCAYLMVDALCLEVFREVSFFFVHSLNILPISCRCF